MTDSGSRRSFKRHADAYALMQQAPIGPGLRKSTELALARERAMIDSILDLWLEDHPMGIELEPIPFEAHTSSAT